MQRFIYFVLAGVGLASLATILAALTWLLGQPSSQLHQVSLAWVLTICSAFMVLTAWMAICLRQLAKKLEAMQKVAITDHLTRVANRTALTEMLQGSLVQAALKNGHLAVLSLDLDDFKQLNDEYGHHAGDAALKVAAKRITSSVRRYERVFRMGGDEFLCLVFDPDPKAAAQMVVDRLIASFEVPMDLGDHQQVVTPSIGVAIAEPGETWDAVLKRSDIAMYRAKQSDFSFYFCGNTGPNLVETKVRQTG